MADSVVPGADIVPVTGSLMPAVLAVKGRPGPAEQAGGGAMSGADGEALAKALSALGFDAERVAAVVSDPVGTTATEERSRRLRLVIEALDPDIVLALDIDGGTDAAAAMGVAEPPPGRLVTAGLRALLVVDGLEASLGEESRKRRVWGQIRALGARQGR